MTPNSHCGRPVVILNMHYTGLAIARGLQECGAAPVYGVGANETMFGNFSRYCKYVRCPDTEVAPDQCRDFLIKFSDQFDTRALLFPTRDLDLQFLSKYYAELEERNLAAKDQRKRHVPAARDRCEDQPNEDASNQCAARRPHAKE